MKTTIGLTLLLLAVLLSPPRVQADGEPPTDTRPRLGIPYTLGMQITALTQRLFPFHSPYEGTNSFRSSREQHTTHTYTIFFGIRPFPALELFVNPEMACGTGLSSGLGIAGFPNGEVIRNPFLGHAPTVARVFGRWTIPIARGTEDIPTGENLIAGKRPTHRVVITAGKFACNDIFDLNGYANSPRTQFMNWSLINSAAYDYAADTRGYTRGVTLEWIQPTWALRAGSFQMPKVANGIELSDIRFAHGDQIELEVHPHLVAKPLILRLLAYRNVAHMGNYRQAIASARNAGTLADITLAEKPGAVKYGFGLNLEQPLDDDGETGVFGRVGWNDGATESFAYTECDAHLSLGGQISGRKWGRHGDRIGVAYVIDALSSAHRDYLAAGGLGFLLGDGRLKYGPERVIEGYYSFQATKFLALSIDLQHIANPGYNRDRGPTSVLSGRAHFEF